jgi:peptidoglycan/xylan/chitin deacetylase (PgdA/CDA1 family)
LSRQKVRAELAAGSRAIVAAGAPAPTLYRPPYGDISPAANAVAARLGLRIVQPFSVTHHGLMVDSRDWTGATPRQIAHAVEHGSDGHAGIRGGSVIAFHDGPECPSRHSDSQSCHKSAVSVIRALPLIVRWMNRHHLGMTTKVPADATGGAVPAKERS